MAETEHQDKRPSCAWPIEKKNEKGTPIGIQACGSEERVYNVKGRGKYINRPRETPICEKHLPEAWKAWKVEEAVPICPQ
jgi:hypothetical protein